MRASKITVLCKVAVLLIGLLGIGTATAEPISVNTEQLQQLIAKGVPVIDVRTPQEWRATGVIPESHLITFFDQRGNYDLHGWLDQLGNIANSDEPFVILCDVGNRSRLISTFLNSRLSFSQVYDATGGIRAWVASALPTKRWP